MIGHQIIELAHQSLIGAKNDRANHAGSGALGFASRCVRVVDALKQILKRSSTVRASSPRGRTDCSYWTMLAAASDFMVWTTA